ncbi:MAG: hypothetical protein QOJ98_3112, partial [Acidobacteriota bacterium]|nr:hypothetical protein [Acidobacteriota bacterium]
MRRLLSIALFALLTTAAIAKDATTPLDSFLGQVR